MEFLARLFDTSDFPARWQCGNWTSAHGWLHVASDLGVWSAYFAIPLVLGYFVLRRRDLPFRTISLLFVAFILLCGTTHLMEAIIFWWPAYRLAGAIKLITAVVSWVTVFALVRVAPEVLGMRSPQELEREIAARWSAEDGLQRANAELERRVEERTTELVQAVAALRDERELLRITLTSIGDGVIVTDPDGHVTFLNRVAESLTGWTTAEAKGSRLEQVFHIVNEESRQPVESPGLRALKEGGIVEQTSNTVLIAKDGTERSIDDSAAPIRNEAGHMDGAVLAFRDITERRRLEKENASRLAAARTLASIVESSDDAIVSVALDGTIQSWNAAAQQMFGYAADEAIDRHIFLVVPPDRNEEEYQILGRIRSGERVDHFDTVWRRVDGRRAPISLSVSPIRDDSGHVIGAAKIARDITERERAEQELRRLASELSDADRRKDEFIATLAHELRNPLAPIRSAAQVLQIKGQPDPDLKWSRDVIERQVGQMARLLDDLLDVSRITRSKLQLRRQRVELAAAVNSALETSRPLIESNGHEIAVSLPAEAVYLDADPLRLAQIFANLLNNAAKYTDRGGHLWLTAVVDHHEVVVSIRDDGIGIAPSLLPGLFEMFSQAAPALERSQGGLGIGLSLVKGLTELHGGSVQAHSEGPDKGSEFVVRLPVAPPPSPKTPPSSTTDLTTVTGFKVVVADDNRDAAESLAMLLKIMGHDTRIAGDGHEAIEIIKDFFPDVVFLDIGMPRLNGYEAAARIREQSWGADVVLVALTGWGQEEDKRRAAEVGFDSHFTKPVDPVTLEKLLGRLKVKGKSD